MKVIFLDIDGVLNSLRLYVSRGKSIHVSYMDKDFSYEIDPVALNLIRRACEETGAVIVISSTWRILYSIEEMKAGFFKHQGWEMPIRGVTKDLRGIRGIEIQEWLDNNEVEQYVIIDDDGDMLESQMNNFVQTSYNNGLLFEDYRKILEILND